MKIEVCLNNEDWIEVNEYSVDYIFVDSMCQLLCIIDEVKELTEPSGIKTTQGKEEDAMKGEIMYIIGSLAQLSRSANIAIVVSSQKMLATTLPTTTKDNIPMKVACGQMDSGMSLAGFDTTMGTTIDNHPGAGLIKLGSDYTPIQYYYGEFEWLQDYFKKRGLDEKGFSISDDNRVLKVPDKLEGTIDLENRDDKFEFEFEKEKVEIDKNKEQKFIEI